MTCIRRLEIHTDNCFRREVTEEGYVDGKALRGINVLRVGQPTDLSWHPAHFIDVIVGSVKVMARSTFAVETFGVIDGANSGICMALTLHEISEGPMSPKQAMRLSEYHGLSFTIGCYRRQKFVVGY